jgi:hypothetical protein
MAPTRRTRTDRSHRVENRKRAAHVVGRDPPRDVSGDWPAELEAVDRLLDDPAFFDPLRAHFHATLGRPSVPIETYLRLMFLKYRHRLDLLAAVRPDPARDGGAAFDDVDEDHDPVWHVGGGGVERGVAVQGGGGQGPQDEPGSGCVTVWRSVQSRASSTARSGRSSGPGRLQEPGSGSSSRSPTW